MENSKSWNFDTNEKEPEPQEQRKSFKDMKSEIKSDIKKKPEKPDKVNSLIKSGGDSYPEFEGFCEEEK